ncbi:uncharacterized protein LOC126842217 isoform X2 [Adelges cooleyi]|uniref:uncharacterized protein LOC126839826 isoform X2 n=1 Tax=Adelges cooleyi TaxID=133065 RepID=UPI00217F9448|nr:uncharacterized protein LOC126839826 isoform X2 [Adelges cooleyi]XP_050435062.1 uncharacterized protein LOC126842217 isoform X2 [Adelges cooleyi]
MTTHNCIVLSLYFILSIKFMMVESTKKISPSYYVNQAFTLPYVNTVNNLITYNEREIKIIEKEIITITTPIRTYNDTKGRNTAFDKFDKKIEDIKCTCSVIVKTKLAYLSNILEGLQSGGSIEVAKDKLTVLKEEAGLMVLMFQLSQAKAGKWFWSYYLKIMAIIEYESNRNFFGDPLFAEDELQSGITNFIKNCKDNKYLPRNRTESDLVLKNSNVSIGIFQKLRATMTIAYNAMHSISIEYLYLKPLWDEQELLFSQITGSAVEWRPTIKRHAVEVNKTKEYIKNRQWISKPFGHLSYHKLIKQIIVTKAYIFLWVMLVIFDEKIPNMDEISFNTIYAQSINTINTVFEFMSYTDTFLYDIVSEYHWTMPEDTNLGNLIARISEKAKDNLVELNGRNSNGSDWIRINVNDELSNDRTMKFLKEFVDYFKQLKAKLNPFYYVLAMNLLSEGN